MSLFPVISIGSLVAVVWLWANLDPPKAEPVAVEEREEGVCALLWQKWTPGAVEKARANGRHVWLHFAADWDIGTAVNEKRLFSNQKVIRKLIDGGFVLLEADLTELDPEVSEELRRYGKATTPTDIVFSKSPFRGPVILPEMISVDEALKALDEVTR